MSYLDGPDASFADSHLDQIEISAKNRILHQPGDVASAPDALRLVREIRRLYRALEERSREVVQLKAKIKAKETLPAFGKCEAPECGRCAGLGSRYCDIHLAEVKAVGWRQEIRSSQPPAVETRRFNRPSRLGRAYAYEDDPGPGWENNVRLLEDD